MCKMHVNWPGKRKQLIRDWRNSLRTPREVPRRLSWMIFSKRLNGGWRNVKHVPPWLGNMLRMLASLPKVQM